MASGAAASVWKVGRRILDDGNATFARDDDAAFSGVAPPIATAGLTGVATYVTQTGCHGLRTASNTTPMRMKTGASLIQR